MVERLALAVTEKREAIYPTLGIVPGGGGRLSQFADGYRAAMDDVLLMIAPLRTALSQPNDEGEGK